MSGLSLAAASCIIRNTETLGKQQGACHDHYRPFAAAR